MECRLIAADPDSLEPFLSGNGEEVSNHLLRGKEPAYFLGLHDDVPRPAEEAPETASHTIGSGNPPIIGGRPEPIIFPFLSGTNDLSQPLGQCYWIDHLGDHISQAKACGYISTSALT